MMFRRTSLILMILGLALLITGCQTNNLKTRKVLPDWSRGQHVGVAAINQAVSTIAEDGRIHMLWVAKGGKALHYTRLDDSGHIQVSTDLEIDGAHISNPQLVPDTEDSLRVLWTDNPLMPRTLFFAKLGPDGQLLSEPMKLSVEGVRISDYKIAPNADGSLDIFWATETPTEGGIYHLRLSRDDQIASANRLLIRNGAEPTLQIATDGMVHLAWVEGPTLQENNVYYAVFNPHSQQLGPKTRVGFYHTSTGLVSYAPTLGLDKRTAYIFWALERRGGGLSPGEAQTYVVSFALDNPDFNEPVRVDIPNTARPKYHAAEGSLPYQRLASADAGWPTSYLYMPATLAGQREELGVFLAGRVATRNRSSMEVVWAIFANGKLKGYQLPISLGNTLRPTGVMDDAGNVHLVWLNAAGFGSYDVYYASTSETVKANLDRVILQDRVIDLLNALWSFAPALGFFPPIFLLWGFASFVWVVGFYLVKVEGGLERRSAQIALIIAILLYLLSKFLLMPGVLFYAPFTDRLPPSLQFIPVLGTPIFTMLVALGMLWLYFRRRKYRSLFAAYVIFILTDALLSLLIYVPTWLGG